VPEIILLALKQGLTVISLARKSS